MTFRRRVRIIYGKELIDILRDRRTLIAMIVVPIVLYPLLMLGSIQAVSYQAESMVYEQIVVGVINDDHRALLAHLARFDRRELEKERDAIDPDALEIVSIAEPLDLRIEVLGSREEVIRLLGERYIHIGLMFDSTTLMNDPSVQNKISLDVDWEDVRSSHAHDRISNMIERISTRERDKRKREAGLPPTFDEPFVLEVADHSAPSSILGQILPLVLILMTITGAIYPAIDLTAGERERGTLESLMVSPVPVIDLIVGKFLVVTTVAIMGAALNLGSVAATVYFGGFDKVIASSGDGLPIGKMVLILLCLIPFAVLMSAVMIAVCSFARTFKEAQNYVTPVILAVLIPGGIAALPATRLEGVMLVMPVGNMVLLAREILLGAAIPIWNVAMVLLSTSLYAAAAVAVAATVFGQESVVFADSASLKSALSRRLIKPSYRPSIAMSLLFVAILFPAWFFIQSVLSPGPDENAAGLLYASGMLMPVLFVALPVAMLVYWKVDVRQALALRAPSGSHLLAAALIGMSAWIPAHELNVLQQMVLGSPQIMIQSAEQMQETLAVMPVPMVILLIAIVPAVCEELLFRGFLLSGLSSSARKWTAIIVSSAIFGVFHFIIFKFPVTAGLGVVLGLICWQSRSIVPAILAHFLHNGLGALSVLDPTWFEYIGVDVEGDWVHLPVPVLVGGGLIFVAGLLIVARRPRQPLESAIPAVADA